MLSTKKSVKIVLSLALLLGIIVSGCGPITRTPSPPKIEFKPYSDAYFGIMYSKDYIVMILTNTATEKLVGIFAPEGRRSISILRVQADREITDSDLEVLKDGWIDQVENDTKKTLVNTEEIAVDGQLAYRITHSEYVYGEEDKMVWLIVTYKADQIFFLTFSAKESDFQSFCTIANKMIDSFEFLF